MSKQLRHWFFIVFGIVYRPTVLFRVLRQKPTLVMPLAIISMLTIIAGKLLSPYKQRAVILSLSEQVGSDRAKEMLFHANQFSGIFTLLTPIPEILKLSGIAILLLWLSVIISGKKQGFTEYFMTAIYAEFILMIKDYITVGVLWIKGIGNVHTLMDMHPAMGLEVFLNDPSSNLVLYTILSNFNPFMLWHIFVLTVGLSTMSQLTKKRSLIITSGIWVLGIGLQTILAILSVNIMRMAGK